MDALERTNVKRTHSIENTLNLGVRLESSGELRHVFPLLLTSIENTFYREHIEPGNVFGE
jgi:hypothetical protein